MSQGYYFTGYGYYYRNQWYSFQGQSTYQKRQMCANTFSMLGYRCPYSSIQLICFRAGGYPKQSCQNYCSSKGGVYTPQPSHPPMNSYYRPWGRSGASPSYNIQPAMCTYTEYNQVGLWVRHDCDLSSSKWCWVCAPLYVFGATSMT